jgi:hypothetical protein
MRPPEGYTWGSLAIECAALLFAMAALMGAAAIATLI